MPSQPERHDPARPCARPRSSGSRQALAVETGVPNLSFHRRAGRGAEPLKVKFHLGQFLCSCALIVVGGIVWGGLGAVIGFGIALALTGRLEWR